MNSDPDKAVVEAHDPVYTIGVIARKMSVSPQTLRLYERKGLVIPYRTETRRRLYSQVDLEWIACIRRQIGGNKLTISGLRRLLSLIPCWEIKPCGVNDREACAAYISCEEVCWNLEETGERCKSEDCRICGVYRSAAKVESFKEFYKMSLKPSA
ncbi:MAG: MerR family transcriptional regulator [Candidatus Neomarinimicrobiota bacterium]